MRCSTITFKAVNIREVPSTMSAITVFKLLRPDLTTYNGCQWQVGEWKETSGEGDLCGSGWLHAYPHPLLAVLFNPLHAAYQPCVLFKADASGRVKREGVAKLGATHMVLREPMELPIITPAQSVRFALYLILSQHPNSSLLRWGHSLLQGGEPSREVTHAAQDFIWTVRVTGVWEVWTALTMWKKILPFVVISAVSKLEVGETSLIEAAEWAVSDKPLPQTFTAKGALCASLD